MKDAVNFDDEDGEETYVPPVQKEESAGDRKSRKAREAQLKAMMEEDDDEEPVPTPEPEPEPEAEEEAAPVKPEAEKSPEPQSTVSGGRRRGKRRVTRKRTTRDEEGYLGKHPSYSFSFPYSRTREWELELWKEFRVLILYSYEDRRSLGIFLGRRTGCANRTARYPIWLF